MPVLKPLNKLQCLLLVVAFAFCNCSKPNILKGGEGYIPVKGGKIWYRVVGGGTNTPVIMIHGGPGFPSYYLNPLRTLSKDRPVITFDLLGCGRSDRISDTTLMTINNSVAQVQALVKTLKLKEFYVYGHSCGAYLAMEYYLQHPEGIKALIMGSPFLSATFWKRDAYTIIATLPKPTELALKNFMENIPQDTAVQSKALNAYYDNFYERKHPLSADVDSAIKQAGTALSSYMWGKNDLYPSGLLGQYEGYKKLPRITVPVLFTAGEYDAARPETVKYYQSLVRGSGLAVIPGASHTTMHDNPEADRKVISNFLNSQDKRASSPVH